MPKATIIGKMRIADDIRLKAPENLIHTLGAINDPPVPPEGSGCDNFCGQSPSDPEPDEIVYIFGDDPTWGYRWWLQQLHTTRAHWTRLGFVVNKGKPTCTENLIIGVVSASVASDPDLFLNMANWEPLWADQPDARYVSIPSSVLPSTSTYYWLSVDIDYNYTAAEGLMLVMMTYEPDSLNGWRSGANTSGNCFDCWYGPLYGDQWAWTKTTGGLSLMSLVHTEPGGALFEGAGVPGNRIFPETAQNNVPYPWSFNLFNAMAGFCGCPETLWFKIWQLDEGGNKVGDPLLEWETNLPCGYYVPITGTILFNEMGGYQFYGLLETGHLEGTTYVVDVENSFNVWVNCTEGAWGCDANGDKWVCTNGIWVKQTPSPHPDCITQCSDFGEADCELYGCWWWNGSCHDDQPTECIQINNKSDCERWGCVWWNNSCHGYNPSTCGELNNQTDCELYKCYWYNGACHSSPQQPEICDWIDAQGGPWYLTIGDVFVIIDSYLYNTPPSGYTFIPTLTNIFGVIDYFLGFDGDAATGCDYF